MDVLTWNRMRIIISDKQTKGEGCYPKYAGNIFFVGVNDVGIADGTDFKLFVSHIKNLGHGHRRLGVAFRRNIIEEQFEIANDHKLT